MGSRSKEESRSCMLRQTSACADCLWSSKTREEMMRSREGAMEKITTWSRSVSEKCHLEHMVNLTLPISSGPVSPSSGKGLGYIKAAPLVAFSARIANVENGCREGLCHRRQLMMRRRTAMCCCGPLLQRAMTQPMLASAPWRMSLFRTIAG